MDPNTFKEKGNNFFKEEDYEEAITCYTKALKFSDRSKNDKGDLYGRQACISWGSRGSMGPVMLVTKF
jgi:tetratricopeptide (TPR) repeat protein